MAILLHEMFKLLTHAKCTDVSIFRLGTSGGLGLEPGTVVVTTEAVNPEAKPVFEQVCYPHDRFIAAKQSAHLLSC